MKIVFSTMDPVSGPLRGTAGRKFFLTGCRFWSSEIPPWAPFPVGGGGESRSTFYVHENMNKIDFPGKSDSEIVRTWFSHNYD